MKINGLQALQLAYDDTDEEPMEIDENQNSLEDEFIGEDSTENFMDYQYLLD